MLSQTNERKKHEDKQNTKTNQWNHKDKTWKRELKDSVEVYHWFAMTSERQRELRRGIAALGERQEWERDRIKGFCDKRMNLYP